MHLDLNNKKDPKWSVADEAYVDYIETVYHQPAPAKTDHGGAPLNSWASSTVQATNTKL
jgi:hypothetical protein